MTNTIAPIAKELLKKELNEKQFIRQTRKGGNEIYSVDIHSSPNVLKEIGRLREITFGMDWVPSSNLTLK
mgnify:CR=1 FL=1